MVARPSSGHVTTKLERSTWVRGEVIPITGGGDGGVDPRGIFLLFSSAPVHIQLLQFLIDLTCMFLSTKAD